MKNNSIIISTSVKEQRKEVNAKIPLQEMTTYNISQGLLEKPNLNTFGQFG